MPRPEEKPEPMTVEEVKVMNTGTTPVILRANGLHWLAWHRRDVYYAKYIDGDLPTTMQTPCRMDRDEFFETFTVHEHDPEFCGHADGDQN